MKSKIIIILSVMVFALGIFCSCNKKKDSADSGDSVSVSESGFVSDSLVDSESAQDSESLHTHAFAFDSWVTAPGLETAGKAKMKCACGEDKEEDVPALSDAAVWKLTADVADSCVGGDAEYTSADYGKVTVKIAAKHDLGDLVPAKEATCKQEGNPAYYQCKKCKKYFGEDGAELTTIVISKTDHTPVAAVQENVKAATCTTAGSYDEVVYCSVCKAEISRTAKTIAALGHTPAAAVRENVKAATCTATGSYDEVVKCSVCGKEISRTAKTIAKAAHTPSAAVQENVKAATCIATGSYDEVIYCSVCKAEISRTVKTVAKVSHILAAAVQENVKAATCYATGSYDEVVYCSVCKAEMSRETNTTAIVDHSFAEDGKCSMCGLAENYAGVRFIGGNDYIDYYSGLFTFNAKGVADDGGIYVGSSYSDSKVAFAWTDYAAGKLTLTVNYNYVSGGSWGDDDEYEYGSSSGSGNDAKTVVYYGFIDKATKAIVVGNADTEKISTSFIVFVPSDAVIESGVVSSKLGNAAIKAGSIVLSDDSLYSVFIKDGAVHFGVTFTDVSGNAVAANTLKSTNADGFTFVVKNADTVVAAYGVKDGSLEALDSVFGVYTNGDDTLLLDGLGNATLGDKVGTYTVNGDVIEIRIIADDKVAEYYEATLDGSAYTVEQPEVTVSFVCGDGHDAKAQESVYKNIDFDLSAFKLADTDTELFRGWKLDDGSLITSDTYAFSKDVTLTANWATKVTISITDEVNGDETITAGEGDNLLDALDAHDTTHDTKVFEKYQYIDDDGNIDIDPDWKVEAGSEININAKYYDDVNVTLHPGPGMGIADIETSIIYKANIKNYLAENYAYTSCIDGSKFDGWFLNEEFTTELDADKLADSTVTDIYGKWSWAGNVKFSEQKSYPFVYVPEKNTWKSSNKGKGSTSSVLEIVVTSGVANIEFDYWITSEKAWDYATIYYYVDGTRKSFTTKGEDIPEASAKHLSTTLTYTGDTDIALRISYAKDSSGDSGVDAFNIVNLKINGIPVYALAPLNPDAVGTYTADNGTVVSVGAGGGVTVGSETVSYTNVSDNVIGVTLAAGYREITLDKDNHTCVIAVPKVSVAYNYNGHGGANTSTDVDKYSTQTVMSETPTADGFTFRGWYKEATFATKVTAGSSFTANDDITFYAKWDKAITVTYKYEDGDAHADETDTTLYANDKVTVKTVDFEFDDKVFAGWFTKNADGEFDTQITTGTALTDDTVLYAKWVEKSPFAGTYTVVKLSSSGSITIYNTSSTKLVVDNFGKSDIGGYNGFSYGNKVTFAFASGSTTVLGVTCTTSYSAYTYYAIYDAATGIIVRANGGTNLDTSDMYVYIPYDASYATSDFAAYGFSAGGCRKILSFKDKTAENAARSIYTNANALYVSASFKDYDGKDIAVADIKNALNLFVYSGELLIEEFAYSGSAFVTTIDALKGYYTKADADTLFLNGAGIAKLGDKTGTYALQGDSENILDVYLNNKAEYVQVTLDKTANTYESVVPTVTITYNYMGHGDTVTDSSTKNVAYTVSTETPVADGFKFRGWYEDETLGTKAKASYTLTDDKTFYAKWDAAVTLTFDYNGQGTDSVVVSGKYVNDKVSGIPTVGSDVTFEGKVFAGWFLKNEDGSFGDAASTSVTLTGNVTYYAKWVFAPESLGTYKGWNLCGNSGSTASLSTTVITIDKIGAYTGARSIKGTLSDNDARVTDGAIALSDRYAYFNKDLGLIWFGYYASTNSVGTDTYLGADTSRITKIEYSGRNDIGDKYIAYLLITYKDTSTKKAFLYKDKIIANVTWDENVDVKDIKQNDVTIYKDNAIFAKVVGNAVLENDGLAGTYTGDYGNIVVDGFSGLTVGEVSADYTVIADRTIKFVLANSMKEVVIDLGNGTYSKVLDGYEGTYTLPDGSSITLDGYGGAGDGKTYVVSGSNITIYEGDTSTTYGLDAANKNLLAKSVFAGYTFSGTYYSDWDGRNSSLKIVFGDSSTISGTIYSGYGSSYYFDFTAELDGNTLVFTFVKAVDSGAVGKTLKATVSGDTITIVKGGTYSSNVYTFTNNGSAKCEGFSL